MNLNIRKRLCSSKWLAVVLVTIGILTLMFGVLIWEHSRTQRAARFITFVDQRTEHVFTVYATGTVEEATNALLAYVRFIESCEAKISAERDVDTLLYIAHLKLAYIFLYIGNEDGSLKHFLDAYRHHMKVQIRTKSGRLVPKPKFVDFAINGLEQVDREAGAAWRFSCVIETNVAGRVRKRFIDRASEIPNE